MTLFLKNCSIVFIFFVYFCLYAELILLADGSWNRGLPTYRV